MGQGKEIHQALTFTSLTWPRVHPRGALKCEARSSFAFTSANFSAEM